MRTVVVIAVAAAGCRGDSTPRHPIANDAPVAVAPAPDAAAAGDTAPVAVCPPCVVGDEGQPPADTLTLVPVAFADLPGWADDKHAEAVPSFLASCKKLDGMTNDARIGIAPFGGRAKQWRSACKAAAKIAAGDDAAAKAMFESEFRAYAAHGKTGVDGKMTGYYVQQLRGSRKRGGKYQTPLYKRPPDLVAVDLEAFLPDARGRRVWGKLDADGSVVPFPTRKEIRTGAIAGKNLELIWVDDPVDALFAQIQGSGRVKLDDGSTMWIEFAGKNGRPYRGVGKILRDMGEPPGTGTMQGIRGWFAKHPDRFDEIADQNTSYVFFSESKHTGAVGSQKVVLTTRRSAAVDRVYVAASTPLWIDTRAPLPGKKGTAPWRRLVIAQDTGGGIRGAVRADIYWGDDAEAAEIAGHMGGPGKYWLLLPKSIKVK
jgi:membrane-bound lytic murein transglycosylase A